MPQAYKTKAKKHFHQLLGVAGYLLLALVSTQLHVPDTDIPAIWLPGGLALAMLITGGRAWIAPVVVAAFLSAVMLQDFGMATSLWSATLGIAGNALFNSFEPILAALLVHKLALRRRRVLRDYRAFIWLVGLSVLAVFLTRLPQTLLMHHGNGALSLPQLFLTNWLSHLIGLLLIAPLTMARWRPLARTDFHHHLLERFCWLLSLAVVSVVILQQQLGAFYLMLPLMTWAATRFSLVGSLLAILMATVSSLWMLMAEPLAPTLDNENILMLQALVAIMMVTSIYVRILMEDRSRVEAHLEETVTERTRQLQLKNLELEDEIDIRQQAEKSYRRSSLHYRALVETASNPIVVTDHKGHISQWNSAAEQLFGYNREDALGQSLVEAFTPESFRDELGWKITKVLRGGVPREQVEIDIKAFDGNHHSILWNLTRLDEEDDDEAQVILIGQDISQIRATQNQLHYLAHYDILTGTANRRLFEDRCRQAIERALRYRHRCALICLDVDHFKRINDTLGHDAGDTLLKTISDRLQESVRGEDTIARLGGDEFAVLLSQVTGPEGCEKVARALLDNMIRPIQVPSGELVITSSIGITIAPDDGSTYEELLKNADMAMYRAKKAGRNTIEFFSQEMNAEIQRQMTTERELREAIRDGDLDLHYQPVINIDTGAISSMEALLRWQHPTEGLLRPARFLEVAEQTGQLLNIGEWVCYNSCLQARVIQTLSEHPVPVSINLSARQYYHPQLCETLQRVMSETHVTPDLLCIEVDERILADRMEGGLNVLKQLKSIGVTLILDRFGSGLSSIRLLRELPFDQVKLDRSLISQVPMDSSASAIVATLVDLARQMDLTIIASGVETDEQLQFLQSVHCRLAQGHRFCAAIPSGQLGQLFQRMRRGDTFDAGTQIDLLASAFK